MRGCKVFTATALSMLLTGASPAQIVPVTEIFQSTHHEWPQQSGGLEVRWARVERNSQVLICGAVRHINARARRANRGLLRKAWVRSGSKSGPVEIRDLSFFADIRRSTFEGARAYCQAINPADKNAELYLGFDAHSGYDAHMDMF